MAETKITISSPVLGVLARAVLGISARLPLSLSRSLGRALGRTAWWVPTRFRSLIESNVERCLIDWDPADRRRLVRRNLVETAIAGMEMGAMWHRPWQELSRLVESVSGETLLDAAVDAGRGVVLLLPHIGNWELFNPVLAERGPFTALYRAARIRQVEQLIRDSRERTGCRMASATAGGVRELLATLRKGGVVVILPDQVPVRSAGVYARFFGHPALTMTLVRGLLQRTGASALFGMSLRNPSGRFSVHFSEGPGGMDAEDVRTAAAWLNRGVEQCVLRCPEQYLWSYRRFKCRPDPGQPVGSIDGA